MNLDSRTATVFRLLYVLHVFLHQLLVLGREAHHRSTPNFHKNAKDFLSPGKATFQGRLLAWALKDSPFTPPTFY